MLDGGVHFVERAAVGDFKLFVAHFGAVVFQVAADADADAGRYLRSGDFHDGVAVPGAFSARYDDARIGEKQAVGADDLRELPFVYVFRIDFIVVDNRAQPRTGQGNFSVRIFALHEVGVHARGDGVFLIVVEAEKGSEADAAHAA